MTELLTAAQMRAIEEAAIASGEVTGLELMERAGRGVVEAIFEEWPELKAGSFRAVVLCGPGNNGGDGFVVARLLKDWGWEVEVFLYGDPDRLPPDARVNYERWREMGEVHLLGYPEVDRTTFTVLYRTLEQGSILDGSRKRLPPVDLMIDALIGTGLTRPADGLARLFDMDEYLHGNIGARWVAVDVPTGMCADSGRIFKASFDQDSPCAVVSADLTVTFHTAKPGHYLERAPVWCGKVVVRDIGLGDGNWVDEWSDPGSISLATCFAWPKGWETHKYTHGHALILSGPSGKGGAARLAARGALRIGAGLVTVGCPPDAIPENAARLDAVMLRPVADAATLAAVLADKRINALCLGPGLGVDDRARGLLAVALAVPDLIRDLAPSGGGPDTGAGTTAGGFPPSPPHEGEGGRAAPQRRAKGQTTEAEALPLPPVGRGEGWGARPTVLDADALTILAQSPDLFAALHGDCVLTPHAGEFARLFPDIAAKLAAPATTGPAYSKVDATREAAARAGCVVLYKGPDTVIADPSGRCAINSAHYDRAAPWLATAGSGDVLAGFIAGLLARGFDPMHAAESAAWLHVECARKFGPGLIAEDLPEQLPAVFRDLGL